MPRYVIDIAFKGTAYAGWQRQPNALTVQEVIEESLSTLLRKQMSVVGAGRTDAGVHALQLPAHFDYDGELGRKFYEKLNGLLPADISIRQCYRSVRNDFHARFDANERAYIYQIVRKKDPILTDFALWTRASLDKELLVKGAEALLTHNDFASFCKLHGNNKTTLCEVMSAYWVFEEDQWDFHIRANRFLRGMVRGIVGTLLKVGEEKISIEELHTLILGRDRRLAGPNVVAKGLFLSQVQYPEGSLMSIYP